MDLTPHASDLNLYQVTIDKALSKQLRMKELEKLYKEKDKESEKLDEDEELSKYFDKSLPDGRKYYIIIETPKGESMYRLTLSLWLH